MKLVAIAFAFSILLMQLSCDSQSPTEDDYELSSITGRVMAPGKWGSEPFPGALVELLETDFNFVDSTHSDSEGVFFFYEVPEGTYQLRITSSISDSISVSVTTEPDSCIDVGEIILPSIVIPMAPAVCLYPEETLPVEVTFNFLQGMITVSEPDYGSGWSVVAEPDGTIDDEYPFLFYEAIVSESPFQRESGFSISREEISEWLSTHLAEWSFTESETEDFVSFWKEWLVDSPYYIIYPQTAGEIDEVVELHVSPAPDNVLRLWFLFVGSDQPTELPSYQIPPVQRDGFFVLEWGGILVDDSAGNTNFITAIQ